TIKHRDGRETDVLYNATVYRDDRGEVLGVFAAARDVTATKRAEEEVRKARDFLENLVDTFNALTDVFYTFDLEGRFLRWNDAVSKVSGYSNREIGGMQLGDFFAGEERARMLDAIERAKTEGHVVVEADLNTRVGKKIPYEFAAGLLKDKTGNPLGLTGLGRDITERKVAETALRQSEARYRAIFEYTGAAKCNIEPDLTISSTNYEFDRMTGSAQRHSSLPRSILDFLAPEAVDEFQANFKELASDPTEVTRHFESAIRGEQGLIHVIASMALIPGSQIAALSLIDITREKLYEKTLEERAEQLSDFLSIAAHELGLPVTVIKGYVQILRDFESRLPKEQARDILASIDDAGSRLAHLVDELLDVSRIEKGRFVVNIGDIDPAEMLKSAVQEMRVKGSENEIVVDAPGDLGGVSGDPEKLKQAVLILLENAVKFSDPSALVEVSAENSEAEFVVSVLDRGIGVRPDARDKIFERFYQVEDVEHHSKPGLGLGLSIAKEIVNTHGGRIWCEEREGGGSIFRFSIPRGGDAVSPPSRPSQRSQ
ncbi:MAG: sensor histidine kinase, partial [Candidatus Geothermincolia bacterium]